MNTLPTLEEVAGSFPSKKAIRTHSESREVAADQVAKGGAIGLFGAALFLSSGLVGAAGSLASYVGVTIGGLALVGIGALKMGRAGSHLLRYGKVGPARALLTAAGLGGSITAFAATHLLLVLEVGSEAIVRALHNGSLAGVLVFSGALSLMALVTLIRWAYEPRLV